MTTFPLSEPATIYAGEASEGASDPLGKGTLAECAGIVADLPLDRQQAVTIQMDDLDLRFGPAEVSELCKILSEEGPSLSNKEIAQIKDLDS